MAIDGAGARDNLFAGRVEELIYHGDHIRVRLSLLGHDDFIVKLPNRPGQVRLEPGQVVNVSWLASDCRALDAE